MALRRRGIDWLLVPSVGGQASARRFAGWIGARQVLINEECAAAHEVEKVFALATRFPPLAAAVPSIPPCRIVADPALQAFWQQRLDTAFGGGRRLRIGLHISARKPSQRWPARAFVEFAQALAARREVEFMLFWSPGDEDDPRHPGDDRKAAEIVAAAAGLRLLPAPTAVLPELIAGLSLCDLMLQSDGGAMHLAAALGKPIVCFFGQSDAARWHPWGVRHVVLQPASRDVAEVSVEAALAACEQLLAELAC
jgi:ADP-heptose:LPS heptosyltransferase